MIKLLCFSVQDPQPLSNNVEYNHQDEANNQPQTEDPYRPKALAGAVPVLANDRGLSTAIQGRRQRPKSLADGIPSETMHQINGDRMREGMGNKAKSTAALPDAKDGEQIRGKPPPVAPKPKILQKPVKEVILNRNFNEGFGFVIFSAQNVKGSVIGMLGYFASKWLNFLHFKNNFLPVLYHFIINFGIHLYVTQFF